MRDRSVAAGLLIVLPFLLGAAASSSTGAPDGPGATEVFRFADPDIIESSGLVVTDEYVVTVNDSGDSGRVFTVDPASGETVGVIRWVDEPSDVEALAPAGAGQVWVADIGDNLGRRESIEVVRVPVGRGDRTVTPDRYRLGYPGRPRDAESLLVHPRNGRLFVVSKNAFGGTVYAAPRRLDPDGVNRLEEVGTVVGIATDGAFFPDGRHLVVRTYARAVVYTFPELETVGSFDLPHQEQGEGIAVAADGEVYVSTEGVRSPLLRLTLPEEVRRALAAQPGAAQPGAAPSPDADGNTTGVPDDPTLTTRPNQPEGFTDAEGEPFRPEVWPWVAGGLVGLVALLVLIRSLRPR
jgi:hypothetical protein